MNNNFGPTSAIWIIAFVLFIVFKMKDKRLE